MSAEDQSAASDATEQTESHDEATEQTSDSNFAAALTQLAAESGHEIGDVAEPEVKAEVEVEPETEADVPGIKEKESEAETESKEPEKDEDAEEEAPTDAKKDEWTPSVKARVAEETAKRRRANERADRAEEQVQQLQAQLSSKVGPHPTEADPFIDVQDTIALDRLERSYDNVLEMADNSPDALVEQAVEAEKKNSGKDLLERFTPEQIVAMSKRKAEKAIRKQIPERRTYLQQRAAADQKAAEIYPELIDNDEFRQAAGFLANSLLSGQAMKAPDALIWIARAVKGLQMEQQRNGHDSTKVKSPEAKKIVDASRQKIAPTPTRSRSLPERRGTVNLEKANQKLEAEGTAEAAEDVVAALFSQRGGSRRVEPVAE